MDPRRLRQRTRRKLDARAAGQDCPYCGQPMSTCTLDHLFVPRSKGGTLQARNRLMVCGPCNVDKGDRGIVAWAADLTQADDPRAGRVKALLAKLERNRTHKAQLPRVQADHADATCQV
jgi:hypothetical protein